MSDYQERAGEDRDEQELNAEEAVKMFKAVAYTDIERDLEMIREISLDLAKLPVEMLSEGDRGCLAYRVSAVLEARKALGDILDVFMQACGDLMEADMEPVDTVGIISRSHPAPRTTWDKDGAADAMKRAVIYDVALDLATNEVLPERANVARLALDKFLDAVSPPTPKVAGCKTLGINPSDYRTITSSSRWLIQVTPA